MLISRKEMKIKGMKAVLMTAAAAGLLLGGTVVGASTAQTAKGQVQTKGKGQPQKQSLPAARAKVTTAEKPGVSSEEKDVTTEYGLAQGKKFYFVLDLAAKRMELRVKGMTLRSWNIQEIRFWGVPAFADATGTVTLLQKSSLKVPERNIIKPGAADEPTGDPTKFQLHALELVDMPEDFDLYFQTGLHVGMRTKHPLGFFGRMGESFDRFVVTPVRNYLLVRKGKQVSDLELIFTDDKSAKAVYWVFYDGIQGIIK